MYPDLLQAGPPLAIPQRAEGNLIMRRMCINYRTNPTHSLYTSNSGCGLVPSVLRSTGHVKPR